MDRAHARRSSLDDVRLALPDAVGIALNVSLRRARSAGRRATSSRRETPDGLRFRELYPAVAAGWDLILWLAPRVRVYRQSL